MLRKVWSDENDKHFLPLVRKGESQTCAHVVFK
jgi:hypothetical protein